MYFTYQSECICLRSTVGRIICIPKACFASLTIIFITPQCSLQVGPTFSAIATLDESTSCYFQLLPSDLTVD